MALFGGTWIWGTVVQHGYEMHAPKLDWVDSGFGRGWAFYIMMQVNLYVPTVHSRQFGISWANLAVPWHTTMDIG